MKKGLLLVIFAGTLAVQANGPIIPSKKDFVYGFLVAGRLAILNKFKRNRNDQRNREIKLHRNSAAPEGE